MSARHELSSLQHASRTMGFTGHEPLLDRYLTGLRKELQSWEISPTEIVEIVGEIERHVADAKQAGRTTAEVLGGLGSADELADAYGAALRMDLAEGRPSSWTRARAFSRRALVALSGSVVTAILTIVGLAALATGLVASVAAFVLPLVPSHLLEPTLRPGLPQLVVLLAGGALATLGLQLLRWRGVHRRLAHRLLARQERASIPKSTESFSKTTHSNVAHFPTSGSNGPSSRGSESGGIT